MVFRSRSKSPLKEAFNLENRNHPVEDPLLETEDADIPMLTDEDINNIVQDIHEKGDIKSESPSISQSMSPIRNISIQEGQTPVEEMPEQAKDSKCPPNEQTLTQDLTSTKENEIQPSASESINLNNQSEIDAIQKHVVDSLLFLDHGKDSKEINNVPEKLEENIDRTIHTKPSKEIVWKNPVTEQAENKSEVLDTMDGIQVIGDENLTLDDAQIDANVVSDNDNVNLESSHIASSNESLKETSISADKGQIITEVPEKMDEDVENNKLEPSIMLPTHDNVSVTSTSVEQSQNTTGSLENMDEDNKFHSEPSQVAPMQDVQETSMSDEQAQTESKIHKEMDEDVENNKLEPSITLPTHDNVSVTSTSVEQSQNITVSPENMDEDNKFHSEPSQVAPMQDNVQETSMSDEQAQTESKIHKEMDEDVENNKLEPSIILPTHDNVSVTSTSVEQSQNTTGSPENMDEDNKFHSEPSQVAPMQDNVQETSMSNEKAQTESKIHKEMDEDVENNKLEPSIILPTHDNVSVTSTSGEQSQNTTGNPEIMDEDNNFHSEPSQVAPMQDNVQETSMSNEQAQTESKIHEEMDEDVENNKLEPSIILPTHDNVSVTSTSVEQSQNTTGSPENMDEDNNFHSEPSQVAPMQDNVRETSMSDEQAQTESKIHKEMDEDVENNVLLGPSQIEKNIDHEIKSPENVNNNVPIKNIWESPLSLKQARKGSETPESMSEHITPIQKTADKSFALNDSQETSVVSEQIGENVDNNVQKPSQITLLQESYKNIPPLDIAIKETDKVLGTINALSKSHASVQEIIQENQISSEHVKENVPGKTENEVLEPLVKHISHSPILETSKENAKSHENLGDNVQLAKIAPIKTSIQESLIPQAHEIKDLENMVANVHSNVPLEPSHSAPMQQNDEETPMLLGHKKERIASENNLEVSQITEKLVEDVDNINLVGETTTSSELEKEKKDPEMINGNTEKNIPLGPSEKDVNQEKVEDSTVEENILIDINTDENVSLEQTQIVPKQQNLWENPISTEQTQKKPEKSMGNIIYDSKSAYSGALKAVPIQEREQKKTDKPVENLIYKENSAHSGSSKVVPIQDSVTKIKITSQKHDENLIHNTNSAHSGSLKVIRDITEDPPAKRARIETKWSIADNNTKNAVQETVSASICALKNVSNDNSDAGSPAPSRVSAQWETAHEQASNIYRLSCRSVPKDMPMDVDSDNSDMSVSDTDDTARYGQRFELQNFPGFMKWCITHGIFGTNMHNVMPQYAKISKLSKHNKGVLKISNVPNYFLRSQVRQLIKKHTDFAGKDIVKKITFIYMYETINPLFKTVLVKWKNQDMLYTVKALLLLKKANLYLDGQRLRIAFDNKQKIDWSNEDRPIQRIRSNQWEHNKSSEGAASDVSAASAIPITRSNIQPFNNGQVDFNDSLTYGLSQEFLTKMCVQLPLTSDVFVKNLDLELKEVKLWQIFSTAGTIQEIRMFPNPLENGLNVLIRYDHPLEAIQAISMFDQISVNDRVLTVSMTKGKVKARMPDGFDAIGPGLCRDGKPMQNVRATMEIELIRAKFDREMDRLKQKVTIITNKLKAVKSQQNQIEQDSADADSQHNTKKAAAAQEPPNANALQQNPQNAVAAISTAIASSIQNNILGMLGMQPNTLQGFMQQSQNSPTAPNWSAPCTDISWTQSTQETQIKQSYPLSGYANMQPASNMQPATNVQPNPLNMQLNPNVQAGAPIPNQSTHGNMQQGFAQPVYSMQPRPSNMQPGPSNMQTGPSNMQTGPSNVPVLYLQSSIAQSGFSNIPPPLNPGIYTPLPVPVNTNPGAYDANQLKPVSRFDIPPPVVKPQNRGQNLPDVQKVPTVTSCQLDKPLPTPKPQNRGADVHTAFKINNPNLKLAPVTKTPKPVGIKFNIPSLQNPMKPVPEVNLDEKLPAVKKREIASSQTKQEAYSKAPSSSKEKSPVTEPWLKKQIKALRRNSKSPERSRIKSPKYDKPKEVRRSRERDHSRMTNRDYSREKEKDYTREKERDYYRPTTVFFKCLPPSVTLDDLEEKMREVGRLVETRSLSKGTAIVSFRRRCDAETCIEMYNKAKVDGQTIEVKWAK